jgi:hypothetical protein
LNEMRVLGVKEMLPLGDPKWKKLKGGYRKPYDPCGALSRLQHDRGAWEELWEHLHHQGKVGESSYAAVPHLVRIAKEWTKRDWNLYSLVSVIEVERHRKENPPIPDWLEDSYAVAWHELLDLALEDIRRAEDRNTIRSILGAIALAKRLLKLGALISMSTDSEIDEILEQYDHWSKAYR